MPRQSCLAAVLSCLLLLPLAQAAPRPFGPGNPVPATVTVSDAAGQTQPLLALFRAQPGNVNLLFLFGGGDLGKQFPGRLWCPDSFEDTHILRTLHAKYRDKGVGFVAVAAAPVYHSQVLGAPARVFLDAADDSVAFIAARRAFIDSTLAAKQAGILPFEPHFDLRFALLLAGGDKPQPGPGWGKRADWHGGFRASDETQYYGVPQFWLLDDEGRVLAPPFRGNVYHPHGGEMHIGYSVRDVDATLRNLLSSGDSGARGTAGGGGT
jgi:hypothetical protein